MNLLYRVKDYFNIKKYLFEYKSKNLYYNQKLIIKNIIEDSSDNKIIFFASFNNDYLKSFDNKSYITLSKKFSNKYIYSSYILESSKFDALNNVYKVIIKNKEGLLSEYLFNKTDIGEVFYSYGPFKLK